MEKLDVWAESLYMCSKGREHVSGTKAVQFLLLKN